MNPYDITDDDLLPIIESHYPDWKDHWADINIAWDWYFGEGLLDKAIKEYER